MADPPIPTPVTDEQFQSTEAPRTNTGGRMPVVEEVMLSRAPSVEDDTPNLGRNEKAAQSAVGPAIVEERVAQTLKQ